MKRKISKIVMFGGMATSALVVPFLIHNISNINHPIIPTPDQSKIFDVVDGQLRGFKKTASIKEISDYCRDGKLILPACESITSDAFNCFSEPFVSTISIDISTKTIDARAFYGCSSVTTISWHNGETPSSADQSALTTVGRSAFAFSGLTSITLPKGLFATTGIVGKGAFANCTSLQTIDCTCYDPTTTLDISGWGDDIFNHTGASGVVKFNASSSSPITTNCVTLWSKFNTSGMSSLFNEADSSGTAWSVQIKPMPEQYVLVNDGCFAGFNQKFAPTTSGYTTVKFPNTVTSLPSNFPTIVSNYTNLHSYDLSATSITTISDSTFAIDGRTFVSISLPNTITTIGSNAFKNCSTTTITMTAGASLATIGDYAFYNCSNFEYDLSEDDSLTSIGVHAFENTKLSGVKIKTTTTLGADCLKNCTNLQTIDLTDFEQLPTWTTGVLTGVGKESATNKIKLKNTATSVPVIDVYRLPINMKTYLNTNYGLSFDTTATTHWTVEQEGVVFTNDDLFNVKNGVLYGWASESGSGELTADELNDILTRCSITSLTIPSTVTSIDENAFYDSTNDVSKIPSQITSINFANGALQSIGNNAFRKLPATVTSITLNGITTLTSIGNNAFKESTGITTISLANNTSLSTIGNNAFDGCSNVSTLNLSGLTALTSIGDEAFINLRKAVMTNLDLSVSTHLSTIGSKAFETNYKMTGTLTLPSSLTNIGDNAFYGCNWTKLILPKFSNLITFGQEVFSSNENLNYIDMSEYSTAPTSSEWSPGTNMFSGIAEYGTLKVGAIASGSNNIKTYLSNYSESIDVWDETT